MRRLKTSLFTLATLVCVSQPAAAETTTYTFNADDLPFSFYDETNDPFGLGEDFLREQFPTQDLEFAFTIDSDALPAPVAGTQVLIADLPADAVTFMSFLTFDGSLTFDDAGQLVDWNLSGISDDPSLESVVFAEARSGYTARGEQLRQAGDVWVRWDSSTSGTWDVRGLASESRAATVPVPPAGMALGGALMTLFAMRRARRRG